MKPDTQLLTQVRRRLAQDADTDLGTVVSAARRDAGLLADEATLARWDVDLSADLTGAGRLEPLLALPDVTDVLVNGPGEVWIDRGHGLERTAVAFSSDAEVRELAYRLAVTAGRRLDDAQPFVDARLPDGTRLHAILPPLADRITLSLRVLTRRRLTMADLVALETFGPAMAELLAAIVDSRLAFLISGGTGSGKTTVLGALLGLVAPDQRIVLIEDVAEVATVHPHVVRLLARAPNIEQAGSVGLRELVRQALRMRPDRIVVGEFRGPEIVELLAALNTGHAGGAATVHANGLSDIPARLEALGALGGLGRDALIAQAAAGLDVALHLARNGRGGRRLVSLGWIVRNRSGFSVRTIWTAEDGLGPGADDLARRLRRERSGGLPELLRRSA